MLKFLLLLCFFSVGLSSTGLADEPNEKPFAKVYVVDSGSIYDTAIIVGVLSSLESEMTDKDLILATNASSLALAIFSSFPNANTRRDYLLSEDYYQFLQRFTVNDKKLSTFDLISPNTVLQNRPNPFVLPPLKQDRSTHAITAGFKAPKGPALMILAAKGETAPFTVVGFSSPEVAKKLEGKKVDLKGHYLDAESRINDFLKVRTDLPLTQAVQYSLANRPLMAKISEADGTTYEGGAIDHDPIDLAKSIGNSVVATFSGAMGTEEDLSIKKQYGYSANEWREVYRKDPALRLIDLTPLFKKNGKDNDEYKKHDMSLKPEFSNAYTSVTFKSRLPELGEYQDNVKWLFDAGEKAGKSVNSPMP